MCVTICGRFCPDEDAVDYGNRSGKYTQVEFCPDEGAVAGYGNRIRAKYTAKWGVQIAGMIFQTGSKVYA